MDKFVSSGEINKALTTSCKITRRRVSFTKRLVSLGFLLQMACYTTLPTIEHCEASVSKQYIAVTKC